jgi:hypothetical protein
MGTVITIEADDHTVTLYGDTPELGPVYNKLEGWYGTPGVDLDFVKRPLAPGAFEPEQTFPDEAVISIEGTNVGTPWAMTRAAALQLREDLTELYNEGRSVKVTVADDLRTTFRYCKVEAVGLPWSIHSDFDFSIDMKAADPRRYSEPVSVSTGLASAGSGLLLPFDEGTGVGLKLPSDETPTPDLGLDLGTLGTNGRLVVTNPGNVATVSVFEVTGGDMPDGFEVVNIATGERLVYLGAVSAADTITLDGNTQTVFINGTAPGGRWLATSQWWSVPKRSSIEVAFLSRGATTGTPTLTATTSPAYN